MNTFNDLKLFLSTHQSTWCLTGVAGFIGSNILETLLGLNQKVVGLDNFATGHQKNLDQVQQVVSAEQWQNFRLIEGDIRNPADCQQAVTGVQYVLHQAALGSVPRSINDPVTSNDVNIGGHLNMLIAAKNAQVLSFVYAASSSTYGDHPALPKMEDTIGKPLSPYAVTKYVNELYASVFASTYNFNTTGLRYFNVFGPRQDPNGAYAAVIPLWTASIIAGETLFINGDGETSRDFCFVANAVQANILAALSENQHKAQIYNVACNTRTSLNQLKDMLYQQIKQLDESIPELRVEYRDFRAGDILHSQADIKKAAEQLGYHPSHQIDEGIKEAMPWYLANLKPLITQ